MWSGIWSVLTTRIGLNLILNLIYETLDWGRKWIVDFNAQKKKKKNQLVSLDLSNNLAACLEPLAHHQNVVSLKSFFCRYYFGRCSSELAELVPLPWSWGRSTGYSDRLHGFSVTILRCYKDVYFNSSTFEIQLLRASAIKC